MIRQLDEERRSRLEAEKTAERLSVLQRLTAVLAGALTPAEVASAVAEHAMRALGARSAAVVRVLEQPGMLGLVAQRGYRDEMIQQWTSFSAALPVPIAECTRTRKAHFFPSLKDMVSRHPAAAAGIDFDGCDAFACVPMLADGACVGAIALAFPEAREFETADREFIETLANVCGPSLERARLFERERTARASAERTADRLSALQSITASIAGALSPEAVAAVAVERTLETLGADAGAIALFDEDEAFLHLIYAKGYSDSAVAAYREFPSDAGDPLADAVRRRETIVVRSNEDRLARYPDAEGGEAVGPITLCVPLVSAMLRIGVLALRFDPSRALAAEDVGFASSVARQCAQAIHRATLFDEERRARADAQRAEQFARGLADSIPQFVWGATATGWIDYGSSRFLEYVGGSDLIEGWNWQEVLHPEDAPRMIDAWTRALKTGMPLEIEFRARRRDGVYRWFLGRGLPLHSADGTVERWVGTNTDIDDRKRAQDQLHTVLDRVGHDIRNPLFAIVTAGTLLAQSPGLDDMGRKTAARVMSGAQRLDAMTRELLDFAHARLGSGLPVRKRHCDLSAVCRLVAERHGSGAMPVRVHSPAAVTGQFDPDRILQAVENLVVNAVTYGRAGTAVEVRCEASGDGHAVVSVRNEGTPIAPERLPSIFEPFDSEEPRRDRIKHLGIGLYLVRCIAQAHGGEVSVRSTADEGTTFELRLPEH